MWHDLFSFQIPAPEKIVRTIAVYLLILVIFRVIGRRSMAQFTVMDFTVMLLLSNVVQNAIIGNDNSFIGGALGAITLMVANEGVDALAYRFPRFARWVQGRDVVVVRDGEPVREGLRSLRITPGDLDHAVRVQNGNDVSEVAFGQMDADGHLVLSPREDYQSATHAEIQDVRDRLARIEALLSERRG